MPRPFAMKRKPGRNTVCVLRTDQQAQIGGQQRRRWMSPKSRIDPRTHPSISTWKGDFANNGWNRFCLLRTSQIQGCKGEHVQHASPLEDLPNTVLAQWDCFLILSHLLVVRHEAFTPVPCEIFADGELQRETAMLLASMITPRVLSHRDNNFQLHLLLARHEAF